MAEIIPQVYLPPTLRFMLLLQESFEVGVRNGPVALGNVGH